LILRMRDMLALDATGLDALEDLLEKLRIKKKDLILCAPHSPPLFALTRAGFIEKIGRENICGDMDSSLERRENFWPQENKTELTIIHEFLWAPGGRRHSPAC